MSTSSLTSTHLHICSSSHLLSHLLIFTSAHVHIFSRLLYLSLFRREPGQWQRDATKRNPFARNEVRSSKTEEKLRFPTCPRARNEVRSSKTEEKLRFPTCPRNPFARNEVRSSKTEEKLRFPTCPRNPFARNEVRSSKTEEKLRFQVVPRNPFARNEVRSSKTQVKLRFQVVPRNPFARNEVRSSKTEEKLRFRVSGEPFRTKWGPIVKNWGKIAISNLSAQPFRTKWGSRGGQLNLKMKCINMSQPELSETCWCTHLCLRPSVSPSCISPETFAACQVRPFILLFGEMANHLGWRGPKAHSPHDMFIHAGFGWDHFLSFPVHMEMGLHHTTLSTDARPI